MRNSLFPFRRFRNLVAFTVCLTMVTTAHADNPKPPKGFTVVFNGKDLSGWHGMPHFDPYKLAAMPEDQRQAQIARGNEDFKQHWKVDNGELVNDGKGAYAATDRDFGDIELLIHYQPVPRVDHARLENFWNRKRPLLKQGPIQLQTHGGEIRWRNLFVRDIPPAEANDILRRHGAAGFRPVFNGKDFTGWAGPVDQYEVQDGA